MKVERYVEPGEFDRWKRIAEDMGFLYVASGPLVRSSYKVSVATNLQFSSAYLHIILQAGEFYIENVLRGKGSQSRAKSLLAQEDSSDMQKKHVS